MRIGFDRSAARDEARPSISRHPGFPAVVATWFAALLGAGSLVLPVALLERAIGVTGITALLPAAALPLGLAGRGLIAVVSALAGALAGIAIARRVARSHGGGEPDAGLSPRTRRPLNINDELGGDSLVSGLDLLVTKTRAQSRGERSGDRLDMAPLSGGGHDDNPGFDELKSVPAPDAPPASQRPRVSPARPDRNEPLPFSAPSLARRAHHSAPAGDLPQLVERLGSSIERRRETFAGGIPGSPGFDPAGAEEAARATAAYLGRQAAPSRALPVNDAPSAPEAPRLPDRGDTDAALREALGTLRRMSAAH